VSDPPICPSPSPAKLYAAVCHPPVRKSCIMPIPALAVCQYQLMLPASTQIMSSVNTGSCYLQISARSHAICQNQSLVSGWLLLDISTYFVSMVRYVYKYYFKNIISCCFAMKY
jgi:hypothetical protein